MTIRTVFMARKRTVAMLGVSAIMIAAIACSGGDDGETVGQTPSPTDGPPVVNNTVDVSPDLGIAIGAPDIGGSAQVIDSVVIEVPSMSPMLEPIVIGFPQSETRFASPDTGFVETSFGFIPAPAQSFDSAQQHGIWINGIGSIDVEPDVAILSVGVESREATVSEAREAAAVALQAVVDAVIAQGVAVDDIKTTSFRISPQVIYREVRDVNGSYSQPEIIGYFVSNQLSVTIRDLDR
ncbi:MAG: SIMPL domain-containing protein, partial [Chloroflexi bacterium]|nr:SIMPL domain-containing protein [Chloroflexota bacterium]